MEEKNFAGKYIFNKEEHSLWKIKDVDGEFLHIQLISVYSDEENLIHISSLSCDDSIYEFIKGKKLDEFIKYYMTDFLREYNMLTETGDMEVCTDGINKIAPAPNAEIYLLNFYGPTDTEHLENVFWGNYYTNLGEFFSEVATSWSVPQNAKVGDIAVFMCANSAKAKMSHVCAEIKEEYGKDSDIYEFAVAERKFYEKYSGHIVGWGVITCEPDYSSYSEKLGYADININEKFIPPLPYADVKDLFKLNVYGSATRLTKKQWTDIYDCYKGSQRSKPEPKKSSAEKTADEKILRVGDNLEFSKKLDYLVPYFDIHSFMTAVYPEKDGNLPIISKTGEQMGTYFIWSANENPNDSGCRNVLNPDGTKLVEVMPEDFVLPESIGKGREEPDLRVVFTKSKNTGKWMFRGVFKAIFDTKVKGAKRYANIYFRVATEIAIKQDSTKSIRLLNLYSAESFKG